MVLDMSDWSAPLASMEPSAGADGECPLPSRCRVRELASMEPSAGADGEAPTPRGSAEAAGA